MRDSVLTHHVRHFGEADIPDGDVLAEIRQLLRFHMRRKHLLSAPPGILGYPDRREWRTDADFEDIVVDCYVFAVLDRLRGLRNQLRIKPNIDGLIARNVRNFLLERQRACDPVGHAVYGNVVGAIADAEAEGTIAVEVAESTRIGNDTYFRFTDAPPNATAANPDAIREAVRTAPIARDELQDLTRTTEGGREWVAGLMRTLRRNGCDAIRCGDLIAPLAERVRAEWVAAHAEPASDLAYEGEDGFATLVRIVRPDGDTGARERWDHLKAHIPHRIACLDRQQRVKQRLAVVFSALVALIEEDGPSPTQSDLTARTGVARATVSDDFAILGRIIAQFAAETRSSGETCR